MRIEHCGKHRRTALHWFLCTTLPDIDCIVYAIADCPKCKQTVIEYNTYRLIDEDEFVGEWERLKQKEHDGVFYRIKTDITHLETNGSCRPKKQDWQTKPLASDYTLLISSGNHAAINERHSQV